MNKQILINIIIAILSLYSFTFGVINPNYFSLPDSIKAIEDVNQLEPFLNSGNDQYRIWGLIKLGDIGASDDIPRLINIYNNEPFRDVSHSIELIQGIKYFSIEAIGKIGGSEAEAFILNLMPKYMYSEARDSILTLGAICDALGNLGSPEARQKLEIVYDSKELFWVKRIDALQNVFLIELKNPKYSNLTDSLNYLFQEISEYFGKNFLEIENFIITKSVVSVLYKINSTELLTLLSQRVEQIEGKEDLKNYLERTVEGLNYKIQSNMK